MSWIMVDVESDGPIAGDYSMVCFGAVVVEPTLSKTFYGKCKPISDKWKPEALAISGFSRETVMTFPEPLDTMLEFKQWIKDVNKGTARFVADNNGYDYAFISWYFHHFCQENPFGWSSCNLGSFYKGVVKDTWKTFRKYRRTVADHNPLNDAMGNAEAMMAFCKEYDVKIRFD